MSDIAGCLLIGSKIVGHAHVTIQKMSSADSTAILPPGVFAFFKGLDFGDGVWMVEAPLTVVNGISSVDVVGGLTAGAYRICTIMCKYMACLTMCDGSWKPTRTMRRSFCPWRSEARRIPAGG